MGKLAIVLILFGFIGISYAGKPELEDIYKKFTQTFKNTKIKSIRESPIKGLYEVVLDNGDILYTDGKHLFIGHIFTFDGEDITQKRKDEIKRRSKK